MESYSNLEIICPDEPDMENMFSKNETEDEIRELMGREPEENEWIEWVMLHDDVGDYFTDSIVNVVKMPEFANGAFVIDGKAFTFIKT